MKKRELPVVKNEIYTMQVDDIGINGEGIGKVNGYTLFVEEVLPGEEVEVKVVKTKNNYGYAKLENIVKPSEDRIQPQCNVAKRCGGCQLQHLSYEAQLKYKTKKVKDNLQRIGGLEDIKVNDILGMENPNNYRNKVQYPLSSKKGQVQVGFYASRSHAIVETEKCYIQHEINEQIVDKVKQYIEECKVPVYSEVKHKGLIRHILTRVGFNTDEVMVCLVVNGKKLPDRERLVELLTEIPNVKSITMNINKDKTNVILGKRSLQLWGAPYITETIGDLKFEMSASSFFQVNPVQTKVLYDKVKEYAALTGSETVWDAYCGIGSIGLYLANSAKHIYGVEVVEQAVQDAERNAEINDIENVTYFVGKAEEVIEEQLKENNITADVIVVDPPRRGCDEKLLQTITEISPDTIVYVSCDPATLARDLKFLTENGYQVEEVQPVDMFPQTVHVETVVRITK